MKFQLRCEWCGESVGTTVDPTCMGLALSRWYCTPCKESRGVLPDEEHVKRIDDRERTAFGQGGSRLADHERIRRMVIGGAPLFGKYLPDALARAYLRAHPRRRSAPSAGPLILST